MALGFAFVWYIISTSHQLPHVSFDIFILFLSILRKIHLSNPIKCISWDVMLLNKNVTEVLNLFKFLNICATLSMFVDEDQEEVRHIVANCSK
jgi:hypothetical protein